MIVALVLGLTIACAFSIVAAVPLAPYASGVLVAIALVGAVRIAVGARSHAQHVLWLGFCIAVACVVIFLPAEPLSDQSLWRYLGAGEGAKSPGAIAVGLAVLLMAFVTNLRVWWSAVGRRRPLGVSFGAEHRGDWVDSVCIVEAGRSPWNPGRILRFDISSVSAEEAQEVADAMLRGRRQLTGAEWRFIATVERCGQCPATADPVESKRVVDEMNHRSAHGRYRRRRGHQVTPLPGANSHVILHRNGNAFEVLPCECVGVRPTTAALPDGYRATKRHNVWESCEQLRRIAADYGDTQICSADVRALALAFATKWLGAPSPVSVQARDLILPLAEDSERHQWTTWWNATTASEFADRIPFLVQADASGQEFRWELQAD
jgi:hypothetical protein